MVSSSKEGSIVYRKAGTTSDQNILVRVMPGNPKSPNSLQQKPYVVQRAGDKAFSTEGKRIDWEMPEAHIPLDAFTFRGW